MLSIKVVDAVPLSNMELLVFFEDECTKKFDVKKLAKKQPEFMALEDEALFNSVRVEPGGYGISWNAKLDCSEGELYNDGEVVDVKLDDFVKFAQNNLINTKEATEIMGCTKQNIDDLIKRGKIQPVKKGNKYSLFLKTEICKRKW